MRRPAGDRAATRVVNCRHETPVKCSGMVPRVAFTAMRAILDIVVPFAAFASKDVRDAHLTFALAQGEPTRKRALSKRRELVGVSPLGLGEPAPLACGGVVDKPRLMQSTLRPPQQPRRQGHFLAKRCCRKLLLDRRIGIDCPCCRHQRRQRGDLRGPPRCPKPWLRQVVFTRELTVVPGIRP